jgi:hypothetical protein
MKGGQSRWQAAFNAVGVVGLALWLMAPEVSTAAVFEDQSPPASIAEFSEPVLLPSGKFQLALVLREDLTNVSGGVISFSMSNPSFTNLSLVEPAAYADLIEPFLGNPKLLTLTAPAADVVKDIAAGTLVSWQFSPPASTPWSVVFTATGNLTRLDPDTFEDLPERQIQAIASFAIPIPEPSVCVLTLLGLVLLIAVKVQRTSP